MPDTTPPISEPRARLLQAARTHFFAHGFRGVSMDDLARELGMSKKTLYALFPSKAALIETVLRDKLSRVREDLEQIPVKSDTPFPLAIQSLLECVRAHAGEIQPPFLRDIQREHPELFVIVRDERRKLIHEHFARLLKSGRKAGAIRKDIPLDFQIEILISTVDAIVNPARLADSGMTPKTAFQYVIAVFLEGVLVRERSKS